MVHSYSLCAGRCLHWYARGRATAAAACEIASERGGEGWARHRWYRLDMQSCGTTSHMYESFLLLNSHSETGRQARWMILLVRLRVETNTACLAFTDWNKHQLYATQSAGTNFLGSRAFISLPDPRLKHVETWCCSTKLAPTLPHLCVSLIYTPAILPHMLSTHNPLGVFLTHVNFVPSTPRHLYWKSCSNN